MKNAIGPNTAAVHFYAVEQDPDPNVLPLEDCIEIGKANGIAVTVDAAGQIYPLDNFGKYVRMGADFQCIAAKYMGAPQSTGLALGTEDFIRKLGYQSFVGYEGRRIRGIGRPHKVDRQEMIGRCRGCPALVHHGPRSRLAEAEQRSQAILTHITRHLRTEAEMMDNIIGHQPFGVHIEVNPEEAGMTAQNL